MILENRNMPLKRYWVEAAIAGAASLAGAGISAAGSSKLNKKTMKFNAEQADIQRKWSEKMYNDANAWNLEMWNKENEYNTPEAQMQRLRDAGLNPLYYGLDGTGNAGDLSAVQPLGYDRANATNLQNPGAPFQDVATKVAQIANIQADTAKKNNENQTETVKREQIQTDIQKTKQELENLKSSQALTESQKAQIDKATQWMDRLNEASVAEQESRTKLNDSQRNRIDELLEGEKILQSKNIEDFDHKWQKIRAEIAKMAAETNLSERDLENYAINHANNGFMGSGLSIQNAFRLGDSIRRGLNKITGQAEE